MNELHGKVALVTGGSRGIGAAIARALAARGADVAITYLNSEDKANEVVCDLKEKGRRGLALRADAADPAAVAGAVDEAAELLGRLDILVNNAGVFPAGALSELDIAAFDRTVAVNVRGPYAAARAAARHLGDGGRIISIGSNVAERVPFPGLALYALTKTALAGMTRGLARELGPQGITVNLVHPGPTNTDANPADQPQASAIAGLTALGRYADGDEIASVVAFLAGPDARYVTGATVNADGGWAA
ncbi:SDR family oxidoreductase [Dactylosporangium sp. NPDC051485]|uniref:SDR family oxidoreductase n=1 Tax=Dactylosporangium sp. NPDC051485 TaxID=3154846 RepID=UPI00341B5054